MAELAMTSFDAKLDRLVRRHAELRDLLAAPGGEASFAKLSKEYSDLTPLVEGVEALRKAQPELVELETLSEDPGDPEMRELAAAELQELKARLPDLEQQI